MKPQPLRIGEILVEQGVLSEQQAFEIAQQQKRKHVPFGVLAEQMFDVTVHAIEEAWIEQYHRYTGTIDLTDQRFDEQALKQLNRRQAWQFELLPVHEEPTGELLLAAGRHRLARAVTFAVKQIDRPVFFRVAEREQLRGFLRTHYPMPEVSDQIIQLARRMADEWRGAA